MRLLDTDARPWQRAEPVTLATAVGNFGVEVDPIQKALKPVLAIVGGFLASQKRALATAWRG